MQLGMIGLGRMGAGMVKRLLLGGHQCVVYDRNLDAVKALAAEGATGAFSLEEFVSRLTPPRAAWLMVPAAVVNSTLVELTPLFLQEDVVIDGGNSHYIDDIRRSEALGTRGIHYVRRRYQRRRLGLGARLLHDDRRPRCGGDTS